MLDSKIISSIKEINKDSFYIYDLKKLNEQIEKLKCLPKGIEVFFAIKANPNLEILKNMGNTETISGFEIASKGEAKRVIDSQKGDLSNVIYTGPAKTEKELEFVIKNNIQLINVESLTEAYRINNICKALDKKQDVLLRINTNQEIHGAAGQMSKVSEPSAFGVDENFVGEIVKEILTLKNINLKGYHLFCATGVLDYNDLIKSEEYIFNLVKELENKTNFKPIILDLGGGFGIDYSSDGEFDINGYSKKLNDLIQKNSLEDTRFILELGRYLVANMGYFVTKIIDIKNSKGIKVLNCAAGINAHRRPYALKTNYPTEIIGMNLKPLYKGQDSLKEGELALIHGPLCTSVDLLSNGPVNLKSPAQIGDYIVQSKAGAYGLTMSSIDFLSHPKIEEIILD